MPVRLKTLEEIALIKRSADLLGRAHGEVAKLVVKGATTLEMDRRAEEFILDHGGTPSFKGFSGFPYSLCVSPNDVVVHGFPSEKPLEEGDIVSIDCGVLLDGFHSDSAYTYAIGAIDDVTKTLLLKTKESLYKGIGILGRNTRLGDLGFEIQNYVESFGFSVPRELTGHGIGRSLHEEPMVCNYGKKGTGKKLKDGMVLAIEPMVNIGTYKIKQSADGWTIRTGDGKNSAHYEHTIAIVDGEPQVLTTFEHIEKVYNG